jgi:hypothetical protein
MHPPVEPIVPQIATSSSPTMSSTSAEDIIVRSPGAGQTGSAKGALRLFSQPVIKDDTAQDSKTSAVRIFAVNMECVITELIRISVLLVDSTSNSSYWKPFFSRS